MTASNCISIKNFPNLEPQKEIATYGRYAVAVFQDVNGNGKLEMILDLAAAEPIGVSNNARGPLLKPPSFADAAFDVASDNTDMSLDLR